MDVGYPMLMRLLNGFSNDPNKIWGKPFNAIGGSVDLSEVLIRKSKLRNKIKQVHINGARLRSMTYSDEQLAVWNEGLKKEKLGRPALRFPGDPERLTGKDAPKRICRNCKTVFNSMSVNTFCFRCCLEDSHELYRMTRGVFLTSLWWRKEKWQMQGIIDALRNEMLFWWWKTGSGQLCYQALTVILDSKDMVSKMILSSLAKKRNRCYTVVFDLRSHGLSVMWHSSSCTTDITKHEEIRDVMPNEIIETINLKFDMLPPFFGRNI